MRKAAKGTVRPISSSRFVFLDGVRGLAALMVLFYHIEGASFSTGFFSHGYLAVDLFFQISGFVMAAAYERKLVVMQAPRLFMFKARLIRLYPIAALGLILGVLTCRFGVRPPEIRIKGIIEQALFVPALLGKGALYPYNNIQWSLFYELAANALHVIVLRRLGLAALSSVLLASAAWLLVVADQSHGLGITGIDVATISGGAARAAFSYTAGVVIFRLLLKKMLPEFWAPALLSLVAMAAAFASPAPTAGETGLKDWVLIVFVLPASVLTGVSVTVRQATLNRLSHYLGELSYPIYCFQQAALFLCVSTFAHIESLLRLFAWAGVCAALCGLSWLALVFFDRPVRQWLERRLGVKTPKIAETVP